jgi:hypothetical protein
MNYCIGAGIKHIMPLSCKEVGVQLHVYILSALALLVKHFSSA